MAIKYATVSFFFLLLQILNPFCKADYVLGPNGRLNSGGYLQYGGYVLIIQQDCNLVLYDNNYPVWATNTGGLASNCYLAMQSDGNLVIYNPYGGAIWASNTGRGAGYYVLVLQNDRNVVVYGGAIWAAHSNARKVDAMAVSLTSGNANSTSNVLATKVDSNSGIVRFFLRGCLWC